MSALTFTLKHRPDQRVDMSPLVPHLLENLEPVQIAALELQTGKRKELMSCSRFQVQIPKPLSLKTALQNWILLGKSFRMVQSRLKVMLALIWASVLSLAKSLLMAMSVFTLVVR